MAGRPPLYETPEEMQAAIDIYFATEQHITITGIALALGFESRQSFYDYEDKEEFSYIIKKARLRVENEYEKKLITANSATGPIFALKNMGWADKVQNELTGKDGTPIQSENKHVVEFHNYANNGYQAKV
jgi:hypothetical protein